MYQEAFEGEFEAMRRDAEQQVSSTISLLIDRHDFPVEVVIAAMQSGIHAFHAYMMADHAAHCEHCNGDSPPEDPQIEEA